MYAGTYNSGQANAGNHNNGTGNSGDSNNGEGARLGLLLQPFVFQTE